MIQKAELINEFSQRAAETKLLISLVPVSLFPMGFLILKT